MYAESAHMLLARCIVTRQDQSDASLFSGCKTDGIHGQGSIVHIRSQLCRMSSFVSQ